MEWPRLDSHPRRTVLRAVLAVVVVVLLLPAAYAAADPASIELGPGTVEEQADEHTVVSVQGFHFAGYGNAKKPARLVAADENAELEWRFDGDEVGARWFYEVDPLDNGTLFVTSTYPAGNVAREMGGTVVFEFDPETGQPVRTFDMPGVVDTHSTTLLSGDRLLVANMREYDGTVSHDRLYVADMETRGEEWEWRFHEHYDDGTAGGFRDDWTHVNDVDVIAGDASGARDLDGDDPEARDPDGNASEARDPDGNASEARDLDGDERYVLTSPRNFDQVIVIDRATDEVVMRLGEDGDRETLYEQHNPDYLERDDGTPVLLVADSGNDRVVEYERDCGDADPRLGAGTPPRDCEWDLVWVVDGFNWPRDADRLPNGNTLVTDTMNHRVVEITPEGDVVWEFYAAWAPYDAERGGEGSDGPTMTDRGTTGSYSVSGGGEAGPASHYEVGDAIADLGGVVGNQERLDWLATRWAHHEPWFRPVWMGSWTFLSTALGLSLAAAWGFGEAVVNRRRLATGVRRRLGRLVDGVRASARRGR